MSWFIWYLFVCVFFGPILLDYIIEIWLLLFYRRFGNISTVISSLYSIHFTVYSVLYYLHYFVPHCPNICIVLKQRLIQARGTHPIRIKLKVLYFVSRDLCFLFNVYMSFSGLNPFWNPIQTWSNETLFTNWPLGNYWFFL